MLTHIQLHTMLALQDKLNAIVAPNWLTAGFAWNRAIMVEAVELLEHVGWKWWKKQEPNIAQAKMELVDIWHFILSAEIIEAKGDYEAAIETIEFSARGMSCIPTRTVQNDVDNIIRYALMDECCAGPLAILMDRLDMSWDELYRTYIAKNVLNLFRQEHGYKAGTYVKVWAGREDNEHLADIMAADPEATPEEMHFRLAETMISYA